MTATSCEHIEGTTFGTPSPLPSTTEGNQEAICFDGQAHVARRLCDATAAGRADDFRPSVWRDAALVCWRWYGEVTRYVTPRLARCALVRMCRRGNVPAVHVLLERHGVDPMAHMGEAVVAACAHG